MGVFKSLKFRRIGRIGNGRNTMMVIRPLLLLLVFCGAITRCSANPNCKLYMFVGDTNADGYMDPNGEYVAWLNKMTLPRPAYTGATFATLPPDLQALFTKYATTYSATTDIDINGARPGTQPTSPEQGASLDALCEEAIALLAILNPAATTAPVGASTTGPVIVSTTTPPVLASTSPSSWSTPPVIASTTTPPVITSTTTSPIFGSTTPPASGITTTPPAFPGSSTNPVYVSATVNPTPGFSTAAPIGTTQPGLGTAIPSGTVVPGNGNTTVASADLLNCKQKLEVSDLDKNFRLNEAEYIAFLNQLTSFAFVSYQSVATLPPSLSQNYYTFALGGEINIDGASAPYTLNQEALDNFCTKTGEALHVALHGTSGNIFQHETSTVTPASPVGPSGAGSGMGPMTNSTSGPGTTAPSVGSVGPVGNSTIPSSAVPATASPSSPVYRPEDTGTLMTIHSAFLVQIPVSSPNITVSNLPEPILSGLAAGYAKFCEAVVPGLLLSTDQTLQPVQGAMNGNQTAPPLAYVDPTQGNVTGLTTGPIVGQSNPPVGSTTTPITGQTTTPIGVETTTPIIGQTTTPVGMETTTPITGSTTTPIGVETTAPIGVTTPPVIGQTIAPSGGQTITPIGATTMPIIGQSIAPTGLATTPAIGVGTATPSYGTTAPITGQVVPVATTPVLTAAPTVPIVRRYYLRRRLQTLAPSLVQQPGTTSPIEGTTTPVIGQTTAPIGATTTPIIGQTTPPIGGTTAPIIGQTIAPSVVQQLGTTAPIGGTTPPIIGQTSAPSVPGSGQATTTPSIGTTATAGTFPPSVGTVAPAGGAGVATPVPTLSANATLNIGSPESVFVSSSPRILHIQMTSECPPSPNVVTACMRVYGVYDIDVAAGGSRIDLYNTLVEKTQLAIVTQLEAAMDPLLGVDVLQASQPSQVDPFPPTTAAPATSAPQPVAVAEAEGEEEGSGGNAFATYGGIAIGAVSAIVCCLGGFIAWKKGLLENLMPSGGDGEDEGESKAQTNDQFNDDDDGDDDDK